MATNEVSVSDVHEVKAVSFDVNKVLKIVVVSLGLAKNIAERMKWEQMAGLLGWISTILSDPELLNALLSLYELFSGLDKEKVAHLVQVVKEAAK